PPARAPPRTTRTARRRGIQPGGKGRRPLPGSWSWIASDCRQSSLRKSGIRFSVRKLRSTQESSPASYATQGPSDPRAQSARRKIRLPGVPFYGLFKPPGGSWDIVGAILRDNTRTEMIRFVASIIGAAVLLGAASPASAQFNFFGGPPDRGP